MPLLAGDLSLTAVNGHPLPFDTGPIPPPGFPEATACHGLISRGSFSAEPGVGTFHFQYMAIDSCSNREIGGGSGEGALLQSGSLIELRQPRGDGTFATYRGTFDGRTLRFQEDFYLLTFNVLL